MGQAGHWTSYTDAQQLLHALALHRPPEALIRAAHAMCCTSSAQPGPARLLPLTTATRRLVLGHGDKQGGAVGQLKHRLNLALAKRGLCKWGDRGSRDACMRAGCTVQAVSTTRGCFKCICNKQHKVLAGAMLEPQLGAAAASSCAPPSTSARWLSRSAPARISLALADCLLTSTTSGLGGRKGGRGRQGCCAGSPGG